MTAQLYWLVPDALAGVAAGDVLVLDGPEGHHAVRVKRLGVGETVLLADGSGVLVEGEARSVDAGAGTAEVRILAIRTPRHTGPRLVLVQALAKSERDEQAVETATELGVDEVIPWAAQRSIVQWRGERGEKSRRKWVSTATAAAKQARRATIPVIAEAVDLAGLARRARDAARTIVLHESATSGLGECTLPQAGDVLLVVGPEGGITDAELAALTEVGARVARLGPEVLRASTAGPAALAALSARDRWA